VCFFYYLSNERESGVGLSVERGGNMYHWLAGGWVRLCMWGWAVGVGVGVGVRKRGVLGGLRELGGG
jgi:hypothetical protein